MKVLYDGQFRTLRTPGMPHGKLVQIKSVPATDVWELSTREGIMSTWTTHDVVQYSRPHWLQPGLYLRSVSGVVHRTMRLTFDPKRAGQMLVQLANDTAIEYAISYWEELGSYNVFRGRTDPDTLDAEQYIVGIDWAQGPAKTWVNHQSIALK